jgi:hypothetical protein
VFARLLLHKNDPFAHACAKAERLPGGASTCSCKAFPERRCAEATNIKTIVGLAKIITFLYLFGLRSTGIRCRIGRPDRGKAMQRLFAWAAAPVSGPRYVAAHPVTTPAADRKRQPFVAMRLDGLATAAAHK